jgi:hypothetical protein
VSTIDSNVVLLICSDERARLPEHGSRRLGSLSQVPTIALPARPGRADLEPVLATHEPSRIVVSGTDADFAAVLLRLLRTERLGIELAYLPARRSAAAAVWGLPAGAAAAALAMDGTATPVPLVRDDSGGVLVGRADIRGLRGECYCDDVLVLRGPAPRLVVTPSAAGIAVRAGRTGRRPDGRVRAVPATATAGRGSAAGRAVQVGCEPATVVHDGVQHPRVVNRWSWYRHTSDWLLVRP